MVSSSKLTCTGVNGGYPINLQGSTVRYSIEVFSNAPAIPGKSTSLTFAQRLHNGRNSGFDTPKLVVTTSIKMWQTHTTTTNSPIDFEHLIDLVNSAHNVMTLTDDAFITVANTTGSKTVMLNNVVLDKDTSDVMDLTLEFIEVNSAS